MKQLSLNLLNNQNNEVFNRDNFVITAENSAAFSFLEKFFAQQNFSQTQIPSVILQGSAAAGKSHMLHIFSQEFGAEFIEQITPNFDKILQENHYYILEDFEQIKDEEALFHLINSAFGAKAFLILSTTQKPKFNLKDLNSRVKNIVTTSINKPQKETIAMLLVNRFGRKQLNVPSSILNFISENIARDYLAINRVIDAVTQYCDENGETITLKRIKEILANL